MKKRSGVKTGVAQAYDVSSAFTEKIPDIAAGKG